MSSLETTLDALVEGMTALKDEGRFNEPNLDGTPGDYISFDAWEWPQGVGLYGLTALWLSGRRPELKAVIEAWYDRHLSDGLPPLNVNTTAPMLALSLLWRETRDERHGAALSAWADRVMTEAPRTEERGIEHNVSDKENPGELWDDTLFMVALFLANYGTAAGRPDLVREAAHQFDLHAKHLTDPQTGLWFHGFSFNGRHNFARARWARGNAWISAAIVDLMELTGGEGFNRDALAAILSRQVDALLPLQTESGAWRTLLDDPSSYEELSATAGFGCALLKGARLGLGDGRWLRAGMRARDAVLANIDDTGTLHGVSYGTRMGHDLQFYRDIPIQPTAYGQAMALLCLAEALEHEPFAAPLREGDSLTHWQVSKTRQTRYDVPDQPMDGAMDPFFFLTRTKNFIPHEYPCRTQFAAHRGKAPEPQAAFAPERNILPFGADRLDLSGFWFRPTHLGTFARTRVVSEGGLVTFRLTTPGAAILFVDGEASGFLAPYTRNLEESADITVTLPKGHAVIDIYLDDLAERDTRYFVKLAYVSGASVSPVYPFAARAETVRAVEATLDALHFSKPSYDGEPLELCLPVQLPADGEARVTVEGDFMSHARVAPMTFTIPARGNALALCHSDALQADYRHFKVAITLNGFQAERTLGIEISHGRRQGEAPAALAERIEETLQTVSTSAEPDTVTALARLASGHAGPETDGMIDAALGPIKDCWDCADFALVPLLWARFRYADQINADLVDRIDETIIAYRYWMDEPGNDVQWYFSENHALLFHTAAYLAGDFFPDRTFLRSGRTGKEQSAVGAARLRAWLDHFERWEMAEFNAAPYFPIDLKGLLTLYALAPDDDIRARAETAALRLLEIVANSCHHGVLTGAQGRSYAHTLCAGASLELSAIARLLWGVGTIGARVHALPQLALALRDHGLVVPDFKDRALFGDGVEQAWSFAQGEERFAALHHAKTRDWALGTAAHYRWYEWGYQETLVHARIGTNPSAQVVINHPGEPIHAGYGRPSYWGGSASIPRVQQYRGLAIVVFSGVAPQPDFTHAWFPIPAFDVAQVDGQRAVAVCGGGAVLLTASGALERVTSGPSAHCELRLQGRQGVWLVRMASRNCADMLSQFGGLNAPLPHEGTITVSDPQYGTVHFHADGRVEAEGTITDPRAWTIQGERRVRPQPALR